MMAFAKARDGMRRRKFIGLIGGAAAWPAVARGQQTSLPVIGVLSSGPAKLRDDQSEGIRRGLKEAGFTEGENLTILYRGADDDYGRLPDLATELVSRGVAVIATAGGPAAALAAKAATSVIPVVFAAVSDPVKSGLVVSLNRPGGNVTGNAGLTIELEEQDLLAAAQVAARELVVLRASDGPSIEAAFAALAERHIRGVLVGADALFNNHRQQVLSLASRHTMAAVYPWREYVTAGGLASYGADLLEGYRLSGLYVGRILRGEKPADLPIIQPTKFELAINLKAARSLGVRVPETLLTRADELIE
jgi:putative ABC transport system substrate-binding protein